MAEKLIMQRPNALTDKEFTYCPDVSMASLTDSWLKSLMNLK